MKKFSFPNCGIFSTLDEPTLNGIKEASPPPLTTTRHPAKKFSSLFLICARRIFSSTWSQIFNATDMSTIYPYATHKTISAPYEPRA